MLSSFKIGNKTIGSGKTFVIAEIGLNHNNDMFTAESLVDVAINVGADAVKFQLLKPMSLGKMDWYSRIFKYCEKKDILWSASTNSFLRGFDFLEGCNVKFHKIASPQTALNKDFVEMVAKTKKPIIMSTGYCDCSVIDKNISIISKHNQKLAILHCVSEYPVKPESLNLMYIPPLCRRFNVPIGFSDHTLGWQATLASVALGASVIEKHITLDRNQDGPDHSFALEPKEFHKMVDDIRIVEKSLGYSYKIVTDKEKATLRQIREKN